MTLVHSLELLAALYAPAVFAVRCAWRRYPAVRELLTDR